MRWGLKPKKHHFPVWTQGPCPTPCQPGTGACGAMRSRTKLVFLSFAFLGLIVVSGVWKGLNKHLFHEEKSALTWTGRNCTFSIKIRSTHCHLLICCSLVFNQFKITVCQRSCKADHTLKDVSRTPISVNHNWDCVPMDYELFAKYDLSEKKKPWYLSAYTIRSLQLSARYWAFRRQQVKQLLDCIRFLNLTGEGVERVACFL